MKTDRFCSMSGQTAAVLLAGLLLAAGHPAAGQISVQIGGAQITFESPSKRRSKALATSVEKVQQKLAEKRRALPSMRGPRGEPAYPRQDVIGLFANTEQDLDQAIAAADKSGLEPLRAWSADEIGRIQEQLDTPAGRTAALPHGLLAPRAAAVIASLGSLRLPWPASMKAAAPQQPTVPVEKTNQLLDQLGEVVGRIFFLASHDDLEVNLWVGSVPAPRVTFRFWPYGNIKGSAPASTSIQTNGKKEGVLRGLYAYSAAWRQGAVTDVIDPSAQVTREALDLVKGSAFLCCDFGAHICTQVDNEKECRRR